LKRGRTSKIILEGFHKSGINTSGKAALGEIIQMAGFTESRKKVWDGGRTGGRVELLYWQHPD